MRWIALLVAARLACAQGTNPKAKLEDYPTHTESRGSTPAIGAEFMVHSFSRGEEYFVAQDYLVVEVAVFASRDRPITVQAGQFSLRINNKKSVLLPQTPQMVAASLGHPE